MTTRVMRSKLFGFLLFPCATLLIGCAGPLSGQSHEEDRPGRVRLGQEFKLRVGEQATVEGHAFKVKFASVANDSRCPVGVTCVWAGNAEVLIEAEASGRPANLKLNTHDGGDFSKEGRHQHYIVSLVALDPYPRADSRLKSTDYVATFLIRKE